MNEHDSILPVDYEEDDCPCCAIMGGEPVILFEELERRGVRLRRPEELSADELAATIAEVGRELAKLRVFLEFTDHLSDEELYRRLHDEILNEWSWISPGDPMSATHIDLVCSGSDEDHLAWLTYYANDEDRREALTWDPGMKLPERRPLPCDRSSVLPKATYGEEADA